MPPDYSPILPWIFGLLIAAMMYRRFRRHFGRQPLRATRLSVRIVVLLVLFILLAPNALRSGAYLSAQIAGTTAGIALALWGAKRTRFIKQNEQLYYIPHTYTGVAVSALLLGRLVYRIVQIASAGGLSGMGAPAGQRSSGGLAAMVQSPLTTGIFFVLIGYYVCYYGVVLWKSEHLAAKDLEAAGPPSGGEADAQARSDATS